MWLAALCGSGAQTIRVPVRLVSVPVLVFAKDGQTVPGLDASDFRVLDNGRKQNVRMDDALTPALSVAIVVQANAEVREYLPFIVKTGSVIESLLMGAAGEAAVIDYAEEVKVAKPFESGGVQADLAQITWSGSSKARMIDAALRAVRRTRILVAIGQAMDRGSESSLEDLKEAAARENVTVFAMALPEVGKAFVSDNVSLEGLSSRTDRGGFKAGVDLGNLIGVLRRSAKAAAGADPFTVLAAATGGTLVHFRKQREFEDAIAAVGVQVRSAYRLTYYPDRTDSGYHTIRVEVKTAGAKVFARPGYRLSSN